MRETKQPIWSQEDAGEYLTKALSSGGVAIHVLTEYS